MWKHFCSLFKKDCQMMISGKFFLLALGSLLLYTLFINFGYVKFMKAELYHVYLYDPQGTQRQVSGMVFPVTSLEELDKSLATDTTGVGIDASSGTPNIMEVKKLTGIGLTMHARFCIRIMDIPLK